MQASATLIHTLKSHSDEVSRLSVSLDGKTIAACDDSVLTIWDLATGDLLCKIEEAEGMIFEIAFSPDSKWIAAASDDDEGNARIWNARTGELEQRVSVEDERMLSVTFSPDGKLLATGSEVLRVWDVETGELLHTLLDPGAPSLSITAAVERHEYVSEIFEVAFSPDGKLLISACPDTSTICIWDTETWTLERTIIGSSLSFPPDGKLAVVPRNQYTTIQIYETSTWQLKSTLKTKRRQVSPKGFSPDSNTIATISRREIELWDVKNGRVIKTFEDPASKISALAFSPDRSVLITGAKKCGLRVWNVESGECLLVLEHEDAVRNPWSANGARCGASAFEVLFTDGGAKVAVAFPDGSIRIWVVHWESTRV